MITTIRKASVSVGIALAVGVSLLPAAAQSADALEVPVYRVVQEGMTSDDAKQLAERSGVEVALRADGSFAYVDAAAGQIPTKRIGTGRDEEGRPIVSEALDQEAIANIRTIPPADAKSKAQALVALPKAYGTELIAAHTELEQGDAKGDATQVTKLDTTVSFQLDLGGIPVVGPGAKARVAFAGDGSVVQLSQAVREVEADGSVKIISSADATKQCGNLYGPEVRQGTPVLAYYAPPLTAVRASGDGSVKTLLPHYICQPHTTADGGDRFGGRMLPAVQGAAPEVKLTASGNGRTVTGSASVTGGTPPYSYVWSSSSTTLGETGKASVSYAVQQRYKADESLTLAVTDANGIAATVAVALPGASGKANGASVAGGVGGDLAWVGIEQTVDEWACAQNSANGFKNVMQSQANTVKFDFRGFSAYEKDFKKASIGGWDASYVDNVDATWYTGHGSPNGFSFKSSVDDTWISPSDARWGDNWNLEWMQLESCQVLRDTNGNLDHFARWDEAFDGLHLLNGFHDNAQCNSNAGGRFASYLYPEKFLSITLRPSLTVRQAWAAMANDLQPAGRRYRTMSPVGANGVNNLNDYFWGQGSVGPDIRAHQVTGWVSVSGVS